MKIELSMYRVLCFTETWFSGTHSSSVYFPSSFNVYRFYRVDTERRSGGLAILVHRLLISKQIHLDIEADLTVEFVAVEVTAKPRSLIYYVCYMKTFDHQTEFKHYQRIKLIMEKYRNHRIIILGDFNIHDIIWTADDENLNVFLPHTITAVDKKNV